MQKKANTTSRVIASPPTDLTFLQSGRTYSLFAQVPD
jgi:hypothetical protein